MDDEWGGWWFLRWGVVVMADSGMNSDDVGCMYTVGVMVVGVSVGHLAGESWGWLTVGGIILLTCWAMWISRIIRGTKK